MSRKRQAVLYPLGGKVFCNSCAEGGGISGWSLKSSRSLRSGIRKRLPVVEAVIVPQFKDRSTNP
ncbi:hypothetical protein A8V42_01370 [Escherichia coli]